EESVHQLLSLHHLPHPSQQLPLVAAVVEEDKVLATVQQVQEGVERLHLLVWAFSPQRVHFLAVALHEQDTQEVDEAAVLAALGLEEDLDRLAGQIGRAVDVDLLLADGQGLQSGVVVVAPSLDPLAPLSGTEGAGQLREREDALAVVLP